jgi:hypothetical protein
LIRTALTLSISAQDAQNTSYLVNGTHLGMLSSAPQNTHVQTNHRPLQLIVAIRNDDLAETASMVRQRYQINAWQDFLQILARHGSNDLSCRQKPGSTCCGRANSAGFVPPHHATAAAQPPTLWWHCIIMRSA